MAIGEVCGMNPWLIDMLQEYDCREIVITQPDSRPKKKTDRRDASFLSNLPWINRQRLAGGRRAPGIRRVNPPTPSEAENRQLTAMRQVFTKKRTAVLNALYKVLRKHNLEQDRPTKLFQTKKVRQWLAEIHLGEIDRMEVNQLLGQWATQRLGSITKQGSKIVRYSRRDLVAESATTEHSLKSKIPTANQKHTSA